jgi:lipid-binding SYLF domain-containing protein
MEGIKEMKKTRGVFNVLTMVFLGFVLTSCATLSNPEKEQQQLSLRGMANEALAQLYSKNPAVKSEISKAAGYAVFRDLGAKQPWIVYGYDASGLGVAVNNTTKQETFMRMDGFQPGSLGGITSRLVFIFETPEAFNSFVTKGASLPAVSMSADVKMLQFNEEGALVGLSLTTANFYKDQKLN